MKTEAIKTKNKILFIESQPVSSVTNTETIIERVETVKELHSVNTRDSKSRKYAKMLRQLIKIFNRRIKFVTSKIV